jgi:hypothetical protein
MNRALTILLCICLTLAGCMGDVKSPQMEPESEPALVMEGTDNQSLQYWNAAPMSMGNISVISFNNSSGYVNLTLELSAFFHDPILWERGFVNYSLMYNNETVFSVTQQENQTLYYVNLTNISGNLTIDVKSSGSDDKTTAEPGDFFIAKTEYKMYSA